ncbi:MAG: oligosaccharide flippase family protein [Lachnospiraceae bacterium]
MAERETKRSNFLVQGTILAMASIMVRLIGLVYRIPMTEIIGDEGNTYYSSAYSVYSILLLLSSYSLPVVVSKMVSARIAVKEYKNAHRVFKCALLFAFCTGLFFTLLCFFGADFFVNVVIHSPMAAVSLKVLAPTILIVALLGVMRGYFQGMSTNVPTAISQILEQIFNAIVSIVASYFLFQYGLKKDIVLQTDSWAPAWGAAGGTLGTGIGALVGLLFCVFIYRMCRGSIYKRLRRDKSSRVESYQRIMRMFVFAVIPVVLSTAVYNLIDLVDNSVFSNYMDLTNNDTYKIVWGVYSGKYLLLVHVPVSVASAMAASSVPAISKEYAAGNKKEVKSEITAVVKLTMLIAIPSAVGLMILSEPIIKLLFPSDNSSAGLYLLVGGFAVIVFSLATLTNGILQGIDRMTVPVRNAAISLILHVMIMIALLWGLKMDIYAVIFSYVMFGLIMATLNCASISKYLGYHQKIKSTYILPGISAAIMGAWCVAGQYVFTKLFGSEKIAVLLTIVSAVMVYFVSLCLTRGITKKELEDMPMGMRLYRVAVKLHLMK